MIDYFRNEKRMLKISGVSFTGGESITYKIYSLLIIFCFNVMYPVLTFMELFKHDFEVVADIVIYVFSTSMSAFKTIVMLRNRILIGKMLTKLEQEPFALNLDRGGTQEEKLIKECVWITNAQTKLYWIITFTTALITASYSASTRLRYSNPDKWELSYGPLTVLNITYSPNFEITWLYQNVSIITIAIHFTTADLLMAAVLAHISYQFKMLQNSIKRLMPNNYKEIWKTDNNRSDAPSSKCSTDGSVIPWKCLHQSLKEAVDYHLAILNLARELEDLFSTLLLLIFLGTLVMLCFLIFRVSVLNDPIQTLRCTGEICVTCFQVATVCYWGEQVISESQQVGNTAFEVNFVGTDVRFQKTLAMIIRRSQNPTKLTAGKFADICLITFGWVLRTSYSSFMVVRTTNSHKT